MRDLNLKKKIVLTPLRITKYKHDHTVEKIAADHEVAATPMDGAQKSIEHAKCCNKQGFFVALNFDCKIRVLISRAFLAIRRFDLPSISMLLTCLCMESASRFSHKSRRHMSGAM